MTQTSQTRFVLVLAVVSALAAIALLAGSMLFASESQAQERVQVECPAGWTPSADGTKCLSDAVEDNVITTTSCTQGVLSDDGQYCIVPRLDADSAAPASADTAGTAAAGNAANADTTAPTPVFTG